MGTSIFLGLLAALLYGATNFAVRPACRGAGVFRTMLYGQWLAIPFLSIALALRGVPHAPVSAWSMLVLSDLLLLCATGFVCYALARGRIPVAAPIAASYGGVSALLSALAGVNLGLPRWTAIGVITLGCVLAAGRGTQEPRDNGPTGALPAACAALLFGLAYWLQARLVIPSLGTLVPVWSYYLLGGMLMPIAARMCKIPLTRPAPIALGWIAATTCLATAAYLTLSAGLASAFPVIVPVLSALSSAITVVLGQTILKERGTIRSWLGVATITLGLVVLRAA